MPVEELRRFLARSLADPGTGWSVGAPGVVAEFVRGADEPVLGGAGRVVTARGGIRLTLPQNLRAIAYETPAGPHDHWNQTVALCLPALELFGDPGQAALKAATWATVRASAVPGRLASSPAVPGRLASSPAVLPCGADPPGRAAVQVALRQLVHLDGPSDALAAARGRAPADVALLDPDGDPNG